MQPGDAQLNELKTALIKELHRSKPTSCLNTAFSWISGQISSPAPETLPQEFKDKVEQALTSTREARGFLREFLDANITPVALNSDNQHLFKASNQPGPHCFFVNDPLDQKKNAAILFSLLWLIHDMQQALRSLRDFYRQIQEATSTPDLNTRKDCLQSVDQREFFDYLQYAVREKRGSPILNLATWEGKFGPANQLVSANYAHPFATHYLAIIANLNNTHTIPLDTHLKVNNHIDALQSHVIQLHTSAVTKLKALSPQPVIPQTAAFARPTTPPQQANNSITDDSEKLVQQLEGLTRTCSLFNAENRDNPFYLGTLILHAKMLCGTAGLSTEQAKAKIKDPKQRRSEKLHKGLVLMQVISALAQSTAEEQRNIVRSLTDKTYEYAGKQIQLFSHRHRWRRWLCCSGPSATEQKFAKMRAHVNGAH